MVSDARRPRDDDDDGEADDRDLTVEGDEPSAPRLDPGVVRRFLSTPATLTIARNTIRQLVPRGEVEELAADTMVRALTAPPPRVERVLPGWLAEIARRVAIRWLEKRGRRAKHEGPMPQHVAQEDAYTGAVADDEGDSDPAYRLEADDEPGDLLGAHLDRLIGTHLHDQETRAILREHAEEARSYADIAAARGLTEAQVANRILRFKKKYAPRVKRRRDLLLVLKLFGGVALAAAALVALWWLLHPAPEIGPDPSVDEPSPAPSATASAEEFNAAGPTQPEPRRKPEPLKPEPLKPEPPKPEGLKPVK
jgi:DNA-directed RNA polymerase specialized sigma24 family protein